PEEIDPIHVDLLGHRPCRSPLDGEADRPLFDIDPGSQAPPWTQPVKPLGPEADVAERRVRGEAVDPIRQRLDGEEVAELDPQAPALVELLAHVRPELEAQGLKRLGGHAEARREDLDVIALLEPELGRDRPRVAVAGEIDSVLGDKLEAVAVVTRAGDLEL